MSTTIDRHMTIKAARGILSNTLRQPPELVRQAETLLLDLRSRKPGYLRSGGVCAVKCVYCSHATWSLHSDGDDERWACDCCHREPGSPKEGLAFRQAQAARARVAAAEAEAVRRAAPSPREVLAAVVAELADAKGENDRLETAATAAHKQLAGAQAGLDAAEAALAAARARLADDAVQALLDPTPVAKKPRSVSAEIATLEMARSGLELATVAAQTIEDMLVDAGDQMRRLEKRRRTAAAAVEALA